MKKMLTLALGEGASKEEQGGQHEVDASNIEAKKRAHLCNPQLIEMQMKLSAAIPETSQIN